MLSITIDEKSITAALAGQLDLDSLVTELKLPQSTAEAKAIEINNHGYILSRQMQPGDALLTISLAPDGPILVLAPVSRNEALGRMLRCTMRIVSDRCRSIPVSWRPFHQKNRLSFQADRLLRSADGGKTDAGRIIVEFSQETGPRVYAFKLDRDGKRELDGFEPDLKLLEDALSGVSKAFSRREPEHFDSLGTAVALDHDLPSSAGAHLTVNSWYDLHLTKSQRQFVDFPLTSSVRLVGPAGSGKTVALVVKCLRHLQATADAKSKRFLFLTHASSTVSEIENLVLSMAPDNGLSFLASDSPCLQISTLYSLANDQMRYDLYDLTPVSLDGYEGQTLQADILNIIIAEFMVNDWIAFKSTCSEPFIAYMEAEHHSVERRFFLWELLNEFACVLDAEGIRSDLARREQYLVGDKRKNWMMVLQSREEREVVLRLYDRFRIWLREIKAIGSDQMIADFLNHLDSFRWEATRSREGFDAVFVDELHLFNRQERMIFRHLLRDPDASPTVLMAYDAKQSPRDTFLGLPSANAQKYDFWREARLGKVEKIELVDVFRYSPQIASALRSIDQAFPGQDLDDDWPAYSGISQTEDGPIPTVCALRSPAVTYRTIFKRAKELQRRIGRSRRVAVLCVSNELFRQYLQYEDLRTFCTPITSRDDVSGMPFSTTKFIFSMPEFVAGLQFDTVLLVEVNRSEVPDGPYSSAALRKFASQVYLGASRAERQLEIYSSTDHGGIAPIISPAVLDGSIKKVEVTQLP